jgi:soluble lytic murein transglycosylase
MRHSVLALGVQLALMLLLPSSGWAAVYAYVDAAGICHFTDAPTRTEFRRVPGFGLPPGANLMQGQYADLIHTIATEEGVDPHLVKAIIRTESNFESLAVSRKGAQGLMQLLPSTASRYAVGHPFNPEANIRGGVRHLRYLQDLFAGSLSLALAAYNAGENAVIRHHGIPPYAETRQYVKKVLSHYGRRDGASEAPGAASRPRSQTETASPPPTHQRIYRRVDAHGVPLYTDLPLAVRSLSPPTP